MVDAVLEGILQLCFPEQYKDKEALVQQDLLNGSRCVITNCYITMESREPDWLTQ